MHAGIGIVKRSNVLLTPSQLAQEHQLTEEFCQTNDNELKAVIARKMMDESRRQERMRLLRETCLPCEGQWPNCNCGGNIQQRAEDLRKVHVEKVIDEAQSYRDNATKLNETQSIIEGIANSVQSGAGSAVSETKNLLENVLAGKANATAIKELFAKVEKSDQHVDTNQPALINATNNTAAALAF